MFSSPNSPEITNSPEIAALTIDEILSAAYEPLPPGEGDEALGRKRLARWIEISADGNQSAFLARLEREGRTLAWVVARLAGVRRRADVPEPHWVAGMHRMFDLLMHKSVTDHHNHIAFAPLLSPIVGAAAGDLWQSMPIDVISMIEPAAFDAVVDHLRRRLSNLCELPFYQALLDWRRSLVDAAKAGNADAEEQLMADSLKPFIQHLRSGGYAHLMSEKPVLFRLLAMLVDQWHTSYLTFFERLAKDRTTIASWLPDSIGHAPLSKITWGLSDPHNGGHSVLQLEFKNGGRVLYKPKDLRPDQFVQSIVASMANTGMPKALQTPEVVAMDGYGWTTFIEPIPCAVESEVASYYRHFGNWLAVFYALSTSDMHMENFIASSEHPVPVDFEMIMQGLRQRPKAVDDDTEAHWLASRFLENSVLSVGMLPAYVLGQDGSLISMGALEPSIYPVKVIDWESINTPRMLLKSATDRIEITSNLPSLDNQPVQIGRYKNEFLAGFVETMRYMADHNAALLQAVGTLQPQRLSIRKVIRPTRFYYMLLKRLYDHRNMGDSVAWSLEADFGARLFEWEGDTEQPWKLAASERRQLLELGIPHFTMSPGSNIIHDRHGPVTRLHLDLGPEVVGSRLASPTSISIDAQADIVRACLQMPVSGLRDTRQVADRLEFAEELRRVLLAQSFRAPRSIAWIGLNRVDHEVAAQMGTLGYDLYYGSTGISVFLAALAHAGNPSVKTQHLEVLRAAIKTLRSHKLGPLARAIGIGGAVGLGSIVYALTFVGDIAADPELFDAADACAHGITPELIEEDDRFDVVAGSAGACLALLSLYRRTGSEWLVERAKRCGNHLLNHRDPASGLWISSAFAGPLTGMAHGAAGFALAMSRLYAVTGYDRFRQVAQDCIEFENAHFDPACGNWIDLRSKHKDGETARPPNQWCYGAPGIGLSRLSMRADGAVSGEVLNADVEHALAATLKDNGGRNSGLCCGDSGHIEFLAVAAAKLERTDLMIAAQKRSDTLIDTWNNTRDLRWIGGTSAGNPGLFQGLSGVGFGALRAAGYQLPSPLAWE